MNIQKQWSVFISISNLYDNGWWDIRKYLIIVIVGYCINCIPTFSAYFSQVFLFTIASFVLSKPVHVFASVS